MADVANAYGIVDVILKIFYIVKAWLYTLNYYELDLQDLSLPLVKNTRMQKNYLYDHMLLATWVENPMF